MTLTPDNSDIAAREAALALLAWHGAMGVDAVVDDRAIDWSQRMETPPGRSFAWPEELPPVAVATSSSPLPPRPIERALPSTPSPSRPQQSPVVAPQRSFQATPPDAAVAQARALADGAADLHALGAALAQFDGCALKATAKNLCFYRGALKARTMIIGEAPGRDEDLEGKPCVGAAGQLLDRMLAAIGLNETNVHIANVVYWRPPGNRPLTPQEIAVCRPFLERQIELVAPEIIVVVGGSAVKDFLGVTEGITRVRGTWRPVDVKGRTYRTLAFQHPSYLLRTPVAKRQTWADLQMLEAALQGTGNIEN